MKRTKQPTPEKPVSVEHGKEHEQLLKSLMQVKNSLGNVEQRLNALEDRNLALREQNQILENELERILSNTIAL